MRRHAKASSAIAAACGIVLCLLCASPALAAKGVVGFFGQTGTQGGSFAVSGSGPGGVAINRNGTGGAAAGDVYVVDRGNNRVQQFSPSGVFKRAFGLNVGGVGINVCTVAASCAAGTASAAAGGMNAPQGIAIEQSTGNLYVTDQGNRRVDVFSAEGSFEGAFGRKVAVTGAAEELQLCTVASGCQAGASGSNPGQFGAAIGYPAISPLNGHVLVADKTNRRVQEFEATITSGAITAVSLVRTFGSAGTGLGQFGANSPADVAVDSNGKVYTVDSGNNRVQSFDATGAGPAVFAEAQLSGSPAPLGVAVDQANNHVLVVKPCSSATCPGAASSTERRVLEFSEAGALLETDVENAGIASANGIAAVAGGGKLYLSSSIGPAANGGGNVPGVFVLGSPPVPPTASIEPVSVFTGTTATFSGHVNPQGYPTTYHFEYSSDGVNWVKLPGNDAFVGADSAEHAVSQQATGLEALTTYSVRLIATKPFDAGSAGVETSFETVEAPPLIAETRAVPAATTVRLEGKINPENQQTNYHFEYVTQAQFEASGYSEATSVPAPDGTVSGGSLTQVTTEATGLSPASAYRFRLVAANPAGPVTGADVAFTTYQLPSVGLPDGRVYEQATPVDKDGTSPHGGTSFVQAAEDGSGVMFFSTAAFPGGESAQEFPNYLSSRSADPPGWSTQSTLPSVASGQFGKTKGWSEDLASTFVTNKATPTGTFTFYLRESQGGGLLPIAEGMANENVSFAAASQGSQEVYFETKNQQLLPNAVAGKPNAYIWDRETGELKLVGVLNSGATPSPTGTFAGSYEWFLSANKAKGGAEEGYYTQPDHVLSRDGSVAFFTSATAAQLYARLNPTAEQSPLNGSEECTEPSLACTVEVSASQRTIPDPSGEKPAAFLTATPDGSKVFFMSAGKLTNDATTGPTDAGNDLYRYDTGAGQLSDLTPDAGDANGAEVRGVLGASADGSYVYFAANGVLASGASPGNCTPLAPSAFLSMTGSCNLYLWHEGTTTFIARLQAGGGVARSDAVNWLPTSKTQPEKVEATARVTPDGETLLFRSQAQLTSYENHGEAEFYRYRVGDSTPTCISCVPTGAPPADNATLQSIGFSFTPIARMSLRTRNLSADGDRVFFETPDKLVAGDENGVLDVYEWEAKGTGSCEGEAEDGGCLFLISTGTSPQPSYFADASAGGEDAFIFTESQLVGQDEDELIDIYDARVGGGIASQNPVKRPTCEGESCKPAATPPAPVQSAGSASFVGPVNPKATRHHHKKKRRKRRHAMHHKKHAHKRQGRHHR